MKKLAVWKALLILGALVILTTPPTGSPAQAEPGCVQPPSGLVSWWPGDGNANDIQDGNHGTLQNRATFAVGHVGQAFLLDGIDDFVDFGNAPNLHVSTGDFTVDAWVNFNSLVNFNTPGNECTCPAGTCPVGPSPGCDMPIVQKMGAVINQDGWGLVKQADSHFWFCLGGGCAVGQPTTVRSSTVVTPGIWFHIAAVKSSSAISIYVNGVLEDTKPLPAFTDTHSDDLRVGSYVANSTFLKGQVDEVEIYNRALTTDEITAIFNAGSAGKCKVTDTTPQVVNVSFPSPNGLNNWFVTSPVVGSVTADDTTTGGSNITAISCTGAIVGSITGLGTPSASASLTVSAEGVNNVSCTATDDAGNSGAGAGLSDMATVQVDTVVPTVALNLGADSCSLPGNAGWCRGTQTAGFSASDATSGVASPCTAAGGTSCNFTQSTTTNGSAVNIASGAVSDVAGNTNPGINAGPYQIDNVAPTITLSDVTAPADGFLPLQSFTPFSATVGSQPVTLNGTVSDNVSVASVVVNSVSATVQPDGSWTAAGIPLNVGDNTVIASATDTAGNIASTSVQITLNLDLDTDGIRNNVDVAPPGPFAASTKFSDEFLGGTTPGLVQDKCVTTNGGTQCESEGFNVGVTLDVLDEPAPGGIRVVVSGPANSFAKVKLACSSANYILFPGEKVLTCNTVTLTVLQGRAEVEFTIGGAVVMVDIEEGSTVILEETIVDGELQELVVSAEEGDVTVNGIAVPPGESLTVIRVGIDIKPGSDPNCFNNDGHGVIPVAILSSADFDAAQVDPLTVSLNGQGVRVVGKGNTQAHQEDVNGNGLVDLVVQIEDIDGTYQEGDTTATLTGVTFEGIHIEGTDSICIVP